MENNISQKHIKMENKKAVKLTDFQKNEENPFMKQAIEGIENHVVKKYKSNSGGDKRAVVALADTETGEVFKTSFIRQIEVDEEQFTKLYLSNFAAFFDLSIHCLHRDIPRRGLPVFQVKPHTAGTAERRGADAPAVEVVTCVKNRHPVVVGERQHARLTARRRQGQHTAVVADEIQRVVYDQRRGRKLGVRAVHLIGLPGGKVGFVDGAVIKAAETVLAA